MSLGFRSESTLTLRKSKELDVVGSNQALSSLSSHISSRSLSLQAHTRKRSRGSRDSCNARGSAQHRESKNTKSKWDNESDSPYESNYGRSKEKRRKGGSESEKQARPNAGVEARAALDKDPSRKEKELIRVKALERKARLYDQLRSNDGTRSSRPSDGFNEIEGGLVDFSRKARTSTQLGEEEAYSLRDDYEQQDERRDKDHHYNYDTHSRGSSRNVAVDDHHTSDQSNEYAYTMRETSRGSGSNRDQFRGNVAGVAPASGSNGGVGFAVRQRYEFGLTAREKAFLPEVAADMMKRTGQRDTSNVNSVDESGTTGTAAVASSSSSSTREDRRAKLMEKLQRS